MNSSTLKQLLPATHACHGSSTTPDAGDDAEASIARVTAVDRGHYIILNAQREVPAKLTGRTFYASESPVDLPCVGDWVRVSYHDAGAHASILDVLPRTSFLRRKKPGSGIGFQMIAANIDVAFIVQSCHFDFNVRRLERYLVMTREGHIEPIVLLTKTDLIRPEALEQLILTIRGAGIGTRVIPISHVSGTGLDQLRALIEAGKTYCLLGSSGVGKTTLVNRLTGNASRATSAVSDSGEGRHTTTRRQLVALDGGGFLVDMPGMRELGVLGVNEGVDESFADLQARSRNCRFSNCTHTSEPGCAIREAIARHELDAAQFQSYLKLKKESEYLEMPCHEKRQKDRNFGKLVRAAMKSQRCQEE